MLNIFLLLLFLVSLSVGAENNTLDVATSTFALKLYDKISRHDGSSKMFAISPLAIYQSLAMLTLGSRKNTKDQLENALNLTLFESSIDKDIIKKFGQTPLNVANTSTLEIVMAKKLWLQRYFCTDYCNKFIKNLKLNYGVEVGQINFAGNPRRALLMINKWIKRRTNGNIPELFEVDEEKTLNYYSRLVLTSAVFFKTDWKIPFDPVFTKHRPFHFVRNRKFEFNYVSMMRITDKFRFASDLDYEMIELPFLTSETGMVIIQPRAIYGSLAQLEKKMNFYFLSDMLRRLEESYKLDVQVTLPVFKIDNKINLKNSLKAIGIHNLFHPRRADLSGITGFRGLYLNMVTHHVSLDANETGIKVAAALSRANPSPVFHFTANRPFLFLVLNKPTRTILMMGRVTDPTLF